MGCLARSLVGLAILGIIGALSAKPLKEKWEERNRPEFKTEKVSRGDVVSFVSATGKIKPIETIKIGSFVSGPINYMPPEIDFNKPVKKDQLMARVDPRLIEAQAKSASASLKIREGDVMRTRAQLQLAINDEQRAIELRKKKADFVSQAEMDRLSFARQQLEASLLVAEASVEQAEAQKVLADVNLTYTDIVAPKAGIIIDRKIEPGQTLAAQFQTPELFEIGVGMDKTMHIYASVDESEIGYIRDAQEGNQPVTFTVTAYRDQLFEGRILQIRMSATETQSVVTYPVIVEAPNTADMKLLPNMTADLSFKIEERKDVLRIPNQALRYLPKKNLVRKEDQKFLDGSSWTDGDDDDEDDQDDDTKVSAEKRTEANKSRNKKHVWVKDGEKLRAIEVEVGLADQDEGKTTQLVTGDLNEDDEVVVGEKKKKRSLFGGGE